MSTKDLIEDLNHLRIKYGTCDVYKSLMKLLREEYEELSSLFCSSPNNIPTSTFFATSPEDYYAAFMKASAEAAHDILQEYTPAPASFYDEENTSLDAQSIHGDEFSLSPEEDADGMDLITQLYNDISSRVESEPAGEPADTPQETLKVIQTCGASAATESSPKKKLLKKGAVETVAVIKEETLTAPAKPKKNTKKTQ
jgi:hypothetical protein